ncbi:MAG: hypothetical protein IKR73_06370 [Oscillospiraceae bacterium]|nr:hypothetical protein [Oscillospiraceae bacterium]
MRKTDISLAAALCAAAVMTGCAAADGTADMRAEVTDASSAAETAVVETTVSEITTSATTITTTPVTSATESSEAPVSYTGSAQIKIAAESYGQPEEDLTEILTEGEDTSASETTAEVSETAVPEQTTVTAATVTTAATAAPKAAADNAPAVTYEHARSAAKHEILDINFADRYKDSLFVGDSICSGLKVYSGLLPVENVAARGNVGTWSLNKYTFPYMSGSSLELDCYSIAQLYQPADIYVWMGMNDLFMVTADVYAQNLKDITDRLRQVSPNSRLHVVSISPISNWHKWSGGGRSGIDRVAAYNAAAADMFAGSTVDVISIYDSLADSEGFLGSAYDGGDGLHLNGTAYRMVLSEIVSCTEDGGVTAVTRPAETTVTTVPATVTTTVTTTTPTETTTVTTTTPAETTTVTTTPTETMVTTIMPTETTVTTVPEGTTGLAYLPASSADTELSFGHPGSSGPSEKSWVTEED